MNKYLALLLLCAAVAVAMWSPELWRFVKKFFNK